MEGSAFMRLVNGYSEVVYYNLAATGGTEALHKLGRASKALYRSHMLWKEALRRGVGGAFDMDGAATVPETWRLVYHSLLPGQHAHPGNMHQDCPSTKCGLDWENDAEGWRVLYLHLFAIQAAAGGPSALFAQYCEFCIIRNLELGRLPWPNEFIEAPQLPVPVSEVVLFVDVFCGSLHVASTMMTLGDGRAGTRYRGVNLLQGVPLPLLGREEGGGSDDEASVTTAIIGQATRACSTSSVGLGDGLCLEDAWFRMHAVRRATGGEKHGHIAIVEDMRGVTAFVHSGSVMISPPRPSLTADLSISPAVLSGEPHSLMSYIDVDPAAFTCDSVEYKCLRPCLTIELTPRDVGGLSYTAGLALLFECYCARYPGSGQTSVYAEADTDMISKGLGSLKWSR